MLTKAATATTYDKKIMEIKRKSRMFSVPTEIGKRLSASNTEVYLSKRDTSKKNYCIIPEHFQFNPTIPYIASLRDTSFKKVAVELNPDGLKEDYPIIFNKSFTSQNFEVSSYL